MSVVICIPDKLHSLLFRVINQTDMQIPLDIKLNDIFSFENFFTGPNAELLDCLVNLSSSSSQVNDPRFIYLWGGNGVGKTHLMQALCRSFSQQGLAAMYIPFKEKSQIDVHVLDNVESLSLLVVDDINEIAGDLAWEEAMFHCYNRIRETSHCRLLVTGNVAPNELDLSLADLSSRLGWGLVFANKPLDDADKIEVLILRASSRGLELTDEVAIYLLNNCPRELNYLLGLLDKLDNASLVSKRKITIPFLKTII